MTDIVKFTIYEKLDIIYLKEFNIIRKKKYLLEKSKFSDIG